MEEVDEETEPDVPARLAEEEVAVPIYEFQCEECGEEFEKLIRSSEKIECPECGSEEVRKLLSQFGFKMGVVDKGKWVSGHG